MSRDAAELVTAGDAPFFLFLSYNAPHAALEAPEDDIRKYAHIEDPDRRVYAAMIESMDQGIGMVVDALAESGKLSNTLIFFLSDNGGVYPEAWLDFGWADNSPFRRGKVALLEGGIHVPFMAHWPEGLPGGTTFDGLVSALDIAATAAALAGAAGRTRPAMERVDRDNVQNVLLQADPYQRRRIEFYDELYRERLEQAQQRAPYIVE